MKTKTTGLIVMLTLMLVLPIPGVKAVPDSEYIDQAVIYMKANHPELALLNETEWDFSLGEEGIDTDVQCTVYTSAYYKDADVNGSGIDYEFEWSGEVRQQRDSKCSSWYWNVTEYSYNYIQYWELNVTKVGEGEGTIVKAPGIYYVKPGEAYTFTAEPGLSKDKRYRFVFEGWLVWNGVSETLVTDKVLTGTANSNLVIRAVFEKKSTATCTVHYEDGLVAHYLWKYRHVPLAVFMPLGGKHVTVTVDSDYGSYNRTFYVASKNFCIYFKAERFEGNYTVTVTAVNGIGTIIPDYYVGIT